MYVATIEKPAAAVVFPIPRAEAQLRKEAAKAHAFGKLFAAAIFASLSRTLATAPPIAARVEHWPDDIARAGVIFRLNAGLHALARSGFCPLLNEIYRSASHDCAPDPALLDMAIMLALKDGEAELLNWLQHPTQTNEVGRVAGLAAVLLELGAKRSMPCDLLELGSSAGLNLNIARYAIKMGKVETGDPASVVRIAPRWIGSEPVPGELAIARAAGVDPNPLDVRRQRDAELLQSYVWPGEHARADRLAGAIAMARRHPPLVERGNAGTWLAQRLATPQASGERRIVFHSMVLQYLSAAECEAIRSSMEEAGRAATEQRPLARLELEWNEDRSAVELCLTEWDATAQSGQRRLVARCHPYAEWFEWMGLGRTFP